jgi:hypothetical protein
MAHGPPMGRAFLVGKRKGIEPLPPGRVAHGSARGLTREIEGRPPNSPRQEKGATLGWGIRPGAGRWTLARVGI